MVWERLGSATVSGAAANTSWKFLGRGTITSAGDVMTTGTITAKDNLMILYYCNFDTAAIGKLTFNGDTNQNYAYRREDGSDATSVSQTGIDFGTSSTSNEFAVMQVNNTTSQEKLLISMGVGQNSNGSSNAPRTQEQIGKWANTSAQITNVTFTNTQGSGNFGVGSEVVVLGMDNDEADTGSNYWQELASVIRTDNGSTLESGNFATKKYLMVEYCSIPANNGFKGRWEFGHSNGTMDTGSNYAQRWEDNGSESSGSSESTFYGYTNDDDAIQHGRAYIFNKSDEEKLVIFEGSSGGSTTGAGNAPSRRYVFAKWTNTSNQITNIRLNNQIAGGDAASGSFIKVYGAD